MISKIKHLFAGALQLLAIAILLLMAFTPPRASAQVTDTLVNSATNLPAIVSGTYASNFVSYVPIKQNSGMAWQWTFNASGGNGPTNGTLIFIPTVDGTNYGKTNYWTLSGQFLVTTNVVAFTNWPATTLAGYSGFFVLGITNGSGGTLTNKGLIYKQWPVP